MFHMKHAADTPNPPTPMIMQVLRGGSQRMPTGAPLNSPCPKERRRGLYTATAVPRTCAKKGSTACASHRCEAAALAPGTGESGISNYTDALSRPLRRQTARIFVVAFHVKQTATLRGV